MADVCIDLYSYNVSTGMNVAAGPRLAAAVTNAGRFYSADALQNNVTNELGHG